MAPVALPHCPSVRSLQSLFLWVWAVRRRLLRTLCLFALLPIHFEFPPPLHRSVHCAALCCMSGTVPTFSDFCFASLHSLFLRALPRCLLRTLFMPFSICCNTSPISTPSPAFCALCCFVLHERHSAHILTFLLCISPLTLSAGPCHAVCCVRYAFLHFFQYISNFQPPPTVLCTVLLPAA